MNAPTLVAIALFAASDISAAEPARPGEKPAVVEVPEPASTPAEQVRPTASEPARPPPPRTIAGTVGSVEPEPLRAVIVAPEGPLTVTLDRNTAIYLPTGSGTVRDIRAGEPVRLSITAESRALWVEVMKQPRDETPAGAASTVPTIPPGEVAPSAVPPGSPGMPAPVTPPAPGTPGP